MEWVIRRAGAQLVETDLRFLHLECGISTLDTNIAQNPRRVTNPNPPGYPRDDTKDGYFPPNHNYNPANHPTAAQPNWDCTVPAVLVRNGIVFDIVARYPPADDAAIGLSRDRRGGRKAIAAEAG